MNRSAAHTALVKSILAELGAMPDILLSINECGRARYISNRGVEFFVPYGFPTAQGGPDVLGVVGPRATLFGMEAKTGNATTTPEQRQVHAALARFGVRVFVVRSTDDARKAIQETRIRSIEYLLGDLEETLAGTPDGDARTLLIDKSRELLLNLDEVRRMST